MAPSRVRPARAGLICAAVVAVLCLSGAAALPLLTGGPGDLLTGLRDYRTLNRTFFARTGNRFRADVPRPSTGTNLSFVLEVEDSLGTIPVTLVGTNNVTTRQHW